MNSKADRRLQAGKVSTTQKRPTPAKKKGRLEAGGPLRSSDRLLRKIALKLEGATEAPHFDMPSFRVRGKIFATARLNEPKAMLKLPRELQEAMSVAHPGVIEPVPGYWGQQGATFVATDTVNQKLFADLVASAWKHASAPKPKASPAKRKRR